MASLPIGAASWYRADHGEEAYALALFALAAFLLLFALVGPWTTKAKAGLFEFDFRDAERDAAARAADEAVPPGEIEVEIASEDPAPPTPSPEDAEIIGTLNYLAGNTALNAVLSEATAPGSPLEHCELRVYLYDAELDRLLPVLSPQDTHEPTAWEVGKGATGVAYQSEQYVLVQGDKVWDDTYGLTPAQQERFRRLVTVASSPIFNASGTVLGVVTASSARLRNRLGTPEGEREHNLVALLVSRILVELLQWFDDS